MELSCLIKVSQRLLSGLESDKCLPLARTLSNLSIFTDLNIYWLLNGRGRMISEQVPEIEESKEQTHLYEDFMFMIQDIKLKSIVEIVIKIYKECNAKKKTQIQGFLSAIS